jgi:hypothetical protein
MANARWTQAEWKTKQLLHLTAPFRIYTEANKAISGRPEHLISTVGIDIQDRTGQPCREGYGKQFKTTNRAMKKKEPGKDDHYKTAVTGHPSRNSHKIQPQDEGRQEWNWRPAIAGQPHQNRRRAYKLWVRGEFIITGNIGAKNQTSVCAGKYHEDLDTCAVTQTLAVTPCLAGR